MLWVNVPYVLQQAHRGSLLQGQKPDVALWVMWVGLCLCDMCILRPLLLRKERLQMLHFVAV